MHSFRPLDLRQNSFFWSLHLLVPYCAGRPPHCKVGFPENA
jgi:hypothetical protein